MHCTISTYLALASQHVFKYHFLPLHLQVSTHIYYYMELPRYLHMTVFILL